MGASRLGTFAGKDLVAARPRTQDLAVGRSRAQDLAAGRSRAQDLAAGRSRAQDLALARAAALGDREAFEQVVRLHGPAMLRYARRVLRDGGDAEEAVQDAFVAAWRSLERYRGDSALRTWLLGLTSHKALDLARRPRPRPLQEEVLLARPADAGSDPWEHASAVDLARALEGALAGLPYRQRACWLLAEVEGLTQAEIAEVLSAGPDVVRGQLSRARRALEERMARWRP